MGARKGLIGLFIFIFFLSSAFLVTLVLDDQKDLSSRASIGVGSSIQQVISPLTQASSSAVFQKSLTSELQLSVNYDNSKWFPPSIKDTEVVFIHPESSTSLKFFLDDRSQIGFNEIILPGYQILSSPIVSSLDQFTVLAADFSYLDDTKKISLWQNDKLKVVVVTSSETPTSIYLPLITQASLVPTKVKGVSTTNSDTGKLATLTRPSVVMLVTYYCGQVTTNLPTDPVLANKIYPFCLTETGTGFFVSPDGYIATNGHVVRPDNKTSLMGAVTGGQLNQLVTDFVTSKLIASNPTINQTEISSVVSQTLSSKESLFQTLSSLDPLLKQNALTLSGEKYQYFVQIANTPLRVTANGANLSTEVLEAKFIDIDYVPYSDSVGFQSSDVALLKIDGQNYPALPLGDYDSVTIGSPIEILGFPKVAAGLNSQILDISSSTEPTVTMGIVSALKAAKGDQKNLIQTDATINYGNSGGPAIDQDGKVIGIATYGLLPEKGTGNYNFLRDITDLKNLLVKNKIKSESGPTYQTWKSGLDSFWLSYYQYATTDFNKIKELYPIHPTVDRYLNESLNKTRTTADKTPMFTRKNRQIYLYFSAGTMLISLIMILVLFIIKPKPKTDFTFTN